LSGKPSLLASQTALLSHIYYTLVDQGLHGKQQKPVSAMSVAACPPRLLMLVTPRARGVRVAGGEEAAGGRDGRDGRLTRKRTSPGARQ
jgi:hypothetical protein